VPFCVSKIKIYIRYFMTHHGSIGNCSLVHVALGWYYQIKLTSLFLLVKRMRHGSKINYQSHINKSYLCFHVFRLHLA